PVLIELVRRRARSAAPHRALFGLSELRSTCSRYQRHRQRMRSLSLHAPNELEAGGDISPLIAAAHLQRYAFAAIELQKIVRLQQHVGKLGKGDSTFDARLHR